MINSSPNCMDYPKEYYFDTPKPYTPYSFVDDLNEGTLENRLECIGVCFQNSTILANSIIDCFTEKVYRGFDSSVIPELAIDQACHFKGKILNPFMECVSALYQNRVVDFLFSSRSLIDAISESGSFLRDFSGCSKKGPCSHLPSDWEPRPAGTPSNLEELYMNNIRERLEERPLPPIEEMIEIAEAYLSSSYSSRCTGYHANALGSMIDTYPRENMCTEAADLIESCDEETGLSPFYEKINKPHFYISYIRAVAFSMTPGSKVDLICLRRVLWFCEYLLKSGNEHQIKDVFHYVGLIVKAGNYQLDSFQQNRLDKILAAKNKYESEQDSVFAEAAQRYSEAANSEDGKQLKVTIKKLRANDQ